MSGPVVHTVTGPVPVDRLGLTLMHEHVITRSPGLERDYPDTYPRPEVADRCAERLSRLRDAGVGTVVDCSPYDLGRDVELLAEVSRRSGMQIVACTGAWLSPARFFQRRAPEEIAPLFVKDLIEGIGSTGIRAGIIKCATGAEGITDPHARVLRACAIAHRVTGAPITTHTDVAVRGGEAQLDLLLDAGVAPDAVIVGHSGDSADLEYLGGLLERGAYLGMDRFGVEDMLADSLRVETVARLCAAGHAPRLLLSHDANCWNDREDEAALRAKRPHHHFHHVLDDIVPALRDSGVTDDQVRTMLVGNPQHIFSAAFDRASSVTPA